MELTKQERALVNFVRGLCFDDLLDANEGISIKAGDASQQATIKKREGDLRNYAGFKERVSRLEELTTLLGDANADYRKHINPSERPQQEIRLNNIFGELKIDGQEVTFRHFMETFSDNKLIYDEDISKIVSLSVSKNVWWGDVQDYLAPIVDEILTESVQEYPEIYEELMQAIKSAYDDMRARRDGFIDFDVSVRGDVAKRIEELAAHIRDGWEIERIQDNVGNDSCYYFTLVRPDEERK